MKNRTKKYLLVAGCLVICAVMVGLIGSRFAKEPIPDDILPAADSVAGDVMVDAGTESDGADATVPIVVKPDASIPAGGNTGSGAVYTGTEQTIQPDVAKPEYDEETLKDPTKTPDGEKVSEPPAHTDHDAVTIPPPASKPAGNGGGSSGGLPGFDNVPNAGENKSIPVDSDGDINKQVGIMG